MPITQERHLELLAAAEDALQALGETRRIIERELALTNDDGLAPLAALENIALLCQPDHLLAKPIQTRLVVERERIFYSPTRLGINRRARSAARRKGVASRLTEIEDRTDD